MTTAPNYPQDLVYWAGHRSGGVRRLFDNESGRPSKEVIRTNLLMKLKEWSESLAQETKDIPRIILLVGGPGNGKTEAIESTIFWLDKSLNQNNALIGDLKNHFTPKEGEMVPRIVNISIRGNHSSNIRRISIVQDASTVQGEIRYTAAQHLIRELETAQSESNSDIYLCCVNRGILDDALIEAIDTGATKAQELLSAITISVGLAPDAPSCWPLQDYPLVAVWPMDAESLLVKTDAGDEPPAASMFNKALNDDYWPKFGDCSSGTRCPFCSSHHAVSNHGSLDKLLTILRFYEIASGKRWSFRDTFSLVSYLFSGQRVDSGPVEETPCEWAARLNHSSENSGKTTQKKRENASALYHLVSSQYQHALFHRWDHRIAVPLLKDLKEINLETDQTALGLQIFLSSRKSSYLPATISQMLSGINELLDPALASPDTEIIINIGLTQS